MAHGFEQNDTMFSVREKPWHGLGTVVEEAPTAAEAIRLAIEKARDAFEDWIARDGHIIPGNRRG